MNRWIALIPICCFFLGCTSELSVFKESSKMITASDFVSDEPQLKGAEETSTLLDDVLAVVIAEASFVEENVEDSLLMPTRVDTPVIVESLVGQVNGRPIFANEVLDPISDQLLILAEETKLDITAFKNKAIRHIENQMQTIVRSELLLSEAKSGMTKEERRGLFAYLERVREDLTSTAGGSQSAVTRQLLDEEGQTVEEYLDYKQQQALIRQVLQEAVAPHVQITWRDIRREWERHKSKFNSPAVVTLGMIRTPSEDLDKVSLITKTFEAGASFEAVATSLGLPNGGRWDSFELGEGGMADIEIADPIKPHIANLEKGEIAGPVQLGSSRYWFSVLEFKKATTGTIWDPKIQMNLRRILYNRQSEIEEHRFLKRILAEGSFDELNTMVNRILHVAVTRYMH
ncbi:MAG TPA: peptidyl-prolyl cis-trans isomerase [Phycisphaerales bacterium]|nr:peptidyl-prolyl cis-trans isomerase [Phycisphaerales bacterium]